MTSGTQGCLYAITPQTELEDQLVIQVTLLLFRFWAIVLFDSSAYACDSMCCVGEFWDEILISGTECKTKEKLNFF